MEIDAEVVKQPKLSPRFVLSIAQTLTSRTGVLCGAEEAQAWWDFVWPQFALYWEKKKYRNVSRAISSWATRATSEDVRRALRIRNDLENQSLEKAQEKLNTEKASAYPREDFFSRLATVSRGSVQ